MVVDGVGATVVFDDGLKVVAVSMVVEVDEPEIVVEVDTTVDVVVDDEDFFDEPEQALTTVSNAKNDRNAIERWPARFALTRRHSPLVAPLVPEPRTLAEPLPVRD